MNEQTYWHWETRSYPGPARRLVMSDDTRRALRRFLGYKMCPAGNGWKGTHERRHLVHALNAETGRPLCISEDSLLDLDRAGLAITDYTEIPNGDWQPLPVRGWN